MKTLDDILKKLSLNKVLPATVVPHARHALPMAQALSDGGLDVMEVTLRNDHALESIRQIGEAFDAIVCGAGTVLTVKDVHRAKEAGAQFGLSPGFNPAVVREAVSCGWPFIPGVQTAGEMEQALELGCPVVKFFPAQAAGGVAFIKAVSAPYAHTELKIIPLGGININNMKEYLALDIVPAVGGSWLANKTLLDAENYEQIKRLAREISQMSSC